MSGIVYSIDSYDDVEPIVTEQEHGLPPEPDLKLISIITAVQHSRAIYLRESCNSVLTQELPDGWELELILQGDGEDTADSILEALPFDSSRIHFESNGSQLGIAPTRNEALRRAKGKFVQSLDSDDVLLPGALARHLQPFLEYPNLHWSTGRADDWLPDGTFKEFPLTMQPGLIGPGAVNGWAIENGGNWPVHCAGVMYRTSTLRALGGWAGLPYDDDIALFASLSEVGYGWLSDQVTWLYRRHKEQTVVSGHAARWSSSTRTAAIQRVNAIRALNLGLQTPSGEWDIPVTVRHSSS